MSNYSQSQSYPAPATSYPAESHKAPPPPGYPMKDGEGGDQWQAPAAAATLSRGDDNEDFWRNCCRCFWKGCCCALCLCAQNS